DSAKERDLIRKADAKIWAEAGSIPLYQRPQLVAVRSTLANVGAFGFEDPAYEDIGYRKPGAHGPGATGPAPHASSGAPGRSEDGTARPSRTAGSSDDTSGAPDKSGDRDAPATSDASAE